MTGAEDKGKELILGKIRRGLGPEDKINRGSEVVRARIEGHRSNLQPQRARVDLDQRIALFTTEAEAVNATVARVATLDDAPAEIARYLSSLNLPTELCIAPDPALTNLPWTSETLLSVRAGVPEAADEVGVGLAFAGVAETGTLVMVSGATAPTILNFLPRNHVVLIRAADIAATHEQTWDRLREVHGGAFGTDNLPPRAVNWITGPSGPVFGGRSGCTSSLPMARPRPPKTGPDGPVTTDSHLWDAAMRDVTPLRDKPAPPARDDRARGGAPRRSTEPTPHAAAGGAATLSHGLAPGLDKRTQMRLKRGQLPIEDRLDLHGMTQERAHRALNGFLERAQAAGQRCVLVITGKGLRGDGDVGILRRQVPRWLNESPNSQRVMAFSYANARDGDEGALYIMLKRRK